MNNLADLISRMLDENGNEISSVREEFEVDNAQLEHPYRILTPDEWNPRISRFVDWLGGLEHAFSALENIPLQSDLVDMPTKRSMGGSMNAGQSRRKDKKSNAASVHFVDPEVTSFWEPELTDRSGVDRLKGKEGYSHDTFTSVTWGNSSDTVIWSDAMEDQQRKFKRQPKRRAGPGKNFGYLHSLTSAKSQKKREVQCDSN